jgi:hypothetical protein
MARYMTIGEFYRHELGPRLTPELVFAGVEYKL